MPRGDGIGPLGRGPEAGRRLGPCGTGTGAGQSQGQGNGCCGRGGGR